MCSLCIFISLYVYIIDVLYIHGPFCMSVPLCIKVHLCISVIHLVLLFLTLHQCFSLGSRPGCCVEPPGINCPRLLLTFCILYLCLCNSNYWDQCKYQLPTPASSSSICICRCNSSPSGLHLKWTLSQSILKTSECDWLNSWMRVGLVTSCPFIGTIYVQCKCQHHHLLKCMFCKACLLSDNGLKRQKDKRTKRKNSSNII